MALEDLHPWKSTFLRDDRVALGQIPVDGGQGRLFQRVTDDPVLELDETVAGGEDLDALGVALKIHHGRTGARAFDTLFQGCGDIGNLFSPGQCECRNFLKSIG